MNIIIVTLVGALLLDVSMKNSNKNKEALKQPHAVSETVETSETNNKGN